MIKNNQQRYLSQKSITNENYCIKSISEQTQTIIPLGCFLPNNCLKDIKDMLNVKNILNNLINGCFAKDFHRSSIKLPQYLLKLILEFYNPFNVTVT